MDLLDHYYHIMRGFDDVLRPARWIGHFDERIILETKVRSKFEDSMVFDWLNSGIEYRKKSHALQQERRMLQLQQQHMMDAMRYGQSRLLPYLVDHTGRIASVEPV